jgi:molybdate transport system regulatory protein
MEGVYVKIKCKVWLEKDGEVILGRGREDLLKAIEECGSLYGAAKKLNMSYRAAWGKIRITEQRLGVKLVSTQKGSKGMKLTSYALALIQVFHECEDDIDSYVEKKSHHFFLPQSFFDHQ